jgi:hypothetical protein
MRTQGRVHFLRQRTRSGMRRKFARWFVAPSTPA